MRILRRNARSLHRVGGGRGPTEILRNLFVGRDNNRLISRHEPTAALAALCSTVAAERGSSRSACALVLLAAADATTYAEENGADEEGGHRSPSPAVGVSAKMRITANAAELSTSLDSPSATEKHQQFVAKKRLFELAAYVIRAAARIWKKRASATVMPAI